MQMNIFAIRPTPVRRGVNNQGMKKDTKKTSFLVGFGLSKITPA
jgi:hypothetical protein